MSNQRPPDAIVDADPLVLDRYVSGQSDEAEQARVEAWIAGDETRARTVDALRRARERGVVEAVGSVEARWARMADALAATPARLPARQRAAWPFRVAVAVMGAVLLVGSLVTWRLWPVIGPQPFRELVSGPGSRTTVTLRDGTRLVLAPSTHLRVPADFGRAERAVELDGEAYFVVVHNPQHPFTVRVGGTTVTDIGTEFDVRGYHDDPSVRVGVMAGEVSVGAHCDATPCGAPAVLKAGDLATVIGSQFEVSRETHLAAMTFWRQGGLAFEDTPLRDAIRDIERTFDVKVTVADSVLLDRPITATFAGQTLNLVLDAVTQALGARYERTTAGVVIRAGAAPIFTHPRSAPAAMTIARVNPTHD